MRKRVTLVLLLAMNSGWAADDIALWNGFSMTPAAGLRHLGLDITRKSDNLSGNIAQDVAAKIFFTLNLESPKYRFGNSGWGISVINQNSFVTLDSQWYSYDGTSTNGERLDVGSEVKGRYSYLVPQIFYETGRPGSGSFKVALGYGLWNANLSGSIKLTANDTPSIAGPATDVTINTTRMAYLFSMSYRTRNNWLYEMSVGGPQYDDAEFRYKIEEVAIIIGKTILF